MCVHAHICEHTHVFAMGYVDSYALMFVFEYMCVHSLKYVARTCYVPDMVRIPRDMMVEKRNELTPFTLGNGKEH